MEGYDDTTPENHLMYVDANNLYGYAMCQPLPSKDIEFPNVELEDVLQTSDDNETGYVLEVDLHIPEHLHDKLKEFPPCPEMLAPEEHMFSDYQNK